MTYPLPLKILGVGHAVPDNVVENAELEARCGLEPGWIERKQGVRERRWADGETSSELGAAAAREALDDAGLAATDIDLILNASGCPEQAIPDGAPLIQRHLGIGDSGIAGFSIHATCLSFLVAFDTAASLIATGRYERILIVSAEITSVGLNFSNPESSTLFGDAAAAAVVGRTPEGEESCVLAARFETYGEGAYLTQVPGGGSRNHPNLPHTKPEDNLFHMEGPKVYKLAIQYAPRFLHALHPELLGNGLGVDLVIPHQASKLALDSHQMMGFADDIVCRTIDRYGNCVAASLPITLYEAVAEGRLERGHTGLLVGTGAGLSFGGVLFKY